MRIFLKTFLFISIALSPVLASSQCELSADNIKVYSLDKQLEYDPELNKQIYIQPLLKDFREYFPKQIKIVISRTKTCSKVDQVELIIYGNKGTQKLHYLLDKETGRQEVSHAEVLNPKWETKNLFSKKYNLTDKNLTITLNKIPHSSLYDQLDNKSWFTQIKYELSFTKDLSLVSKKIIILDSPMSH